MATEHETHDHHDGLEGLRAPREPVREREGIVTGDGGDRGWGGALIAVVAVLAVVLLGWLVISAAGVVLGDDGDAPVEVPSGLDLDVVSSGSSEG